MFVPENHIFTGKLQDVVTWDIRINTNTGVKVEKKEIKVQP